MNDDIYQQMHNEIEQAVQFFGVDCRVSADMSASITQRLQRLLRGNAVYFPEKPSTDQRYHAIRRDFTGDNHNEVCKKHGISRSTLYRATK